MEGQRAKEHLQWSIHTDGSSNKQVGRARLVIHSLEGDEIECMVRLNFPTTNNEAKYKALVAELDLTKAAGAIRTVIYCDS